MAGKVSDSVNNMVNEIGAIQTLIENFPMSFLNLGDLKFSTSFDILSILFRLLHIDREELIEKLTDMLCGKMDDHSDGSGFISYVEEIVKMALEANISNIFNCSTNPIISNNLLDKYLDGNDVENNGTGITLNVSEIDFTGVLNKNPFNNPDDKFYFDTVDSGYNASTVWKSKDFNAFLWYIINKSDKSQDEEVIWDDRYKAKIYGNKNKPTGEKEIIRCTYIDDEYPNSDKIRVQICGARDGKPKNYFKTGFGVKTNKINYTLNKTIFEFNHEFLSSIKLYEPKVIIAEIVEYLLGTGNLSVNLGFSINEEIIQGRIQQIIKRVMETDDLELNDCYFSFSNEEYNEMLEKSEKNRFNIVNGNEGAFEVTPNTILDNLSGITSTSSLIEDKSAISKTLYDISAIPATDPSVEQSLGMTYDWSFELVRIFVYPFVRPLFTPKVMFLLMVNNKIMGSFDEMEFLDVNALIDKLLQTLFVIIKDIIVKIKDIIVDFFLDLIKQWLTPLLELFVSKLLLESLNSYVSLLKEILDKCLLGWDANMIVGNIDNVNYADIVQPVEQNKPEQTIC